MLVSWRLGEWKGQTKANMESESEQTLETKRCSDIAGLSPPSDLHPIQKSNHFFTTKKETVLNNDNIGTKIHYFPIVQKELYFSFPRDPITVLEEDWGVQSSPKRKVLRFHETIGQVRWARISRD